MGLLDRFRSACPSCPDPAGCADQCVILDALVEQTRPLWGDGGQRFTGCAGSSRRRPIHTNRPGSATPGRQLDREEAS